MHTHGHYQQIIARDAAPVTYNDVEDTVLVAPGQRVDVVVHADAQPGTWLVHCHVADHIEDSSGMPAGLITAIHYAGTPNTLRFDVPCDDAGRGRDPSRAELRRNGVARRHRRFYHFSRLADRARPPSLSGDCRAAQRAGHRHPALSRRRDRAKRDDADHPSDERLARQCRTISRVARLRLRRRLGDRSSSA